jgi:hypothetical protein
MLSVIMLNVEFYLLFCWVSFAECRYVVCHNAEECYAECHYADFHYAACHYSECHYADCRDAP